MSKILTDYAVSVGITYFYLLDFGKQKGYSDRSEEPLDVRDLESFRIRVLSMNHWIPISKEEFYKARIGGRAYVKENYHRTKL